VTVKLRSGLHPGDLRGIELAQTLAEAGGAAAISIHPRHASQRHKGSPDHDLVRGLVEDLRVPVLVSGGLHSAQ
jgi:tRNA-dihydrouridine synthase